MADINDKILMQSIHSTIRQVLETYLGGQVNAFDKDDVWLDREAVNAQFSLSPSWINRYGQFLVRVKPEGSAYLYSRNDIIKKFKSGVIENISSIKNNN